MAHTWNHDRAEQHIDKKLAEVESVKIVDYVRDMVLDNIPTNKAYRVDGVHLYADILNLKEMLDSGNAEDEQCHKRTLHFLNLHYRAVSRILNKTDNLRIDFHNQRLHSVVTKPYNTETDAEAKRIRHAVSVSQLILDVLEQTGDEHANIPNAKVRIGIDSGNALAVNNGRIGNKEPLFLGSPANLAAKLSGGGSKSGIYLTNNARKAIGLDEVSDPKSTALSKNEVENCQNLEKLSITADEIVKEWKQDNEKNPIGSFSFSGHTPPLRTLDTDNLTPGNSRRQDAVSIYADIDGFTNYVDKHIHDSSENVVKVFHVIRAELDRALSVEFDGLKIRFIGDCIHGLLCEGTAQTTDTEETISTATLCASGLRSSFNLAAKKLRSQNIDTAGLGLQIGYDYGSITISRLGIQGDRIVCSISKTVLSSENEQGRCGNSETAIGKNAYDKAHESVRTIFGATRKVANLDYAEATDSLSSNNNSAAKASQAAAYQNSSPAIIQAVNKPIRPHAKQ